MQQLGTGAIDEFTGAVAREKAAWEAVRDHLPGSADFDQDLWALWRAAVDESDHAAARARNRIARPGCKLPDSRSPGAWPFARLRPLFSRQRSPGPGA